MSLITQEDINYLAQQSSEKINIILSGMTSLMNDTYQKVKVMESQSWFQRMARTITGKNKLTQAEIQKNHEKLNAYMSEAIAELYNRSCIDHKIIMSLGHQINEIYADHVQLKQILGTFVSKLNQKIESIDNFHILVTEIEQGVYSNYSSIAAICKVMSQLNDRVLDDTRKLDIIKRSLISQNIINDKEISIRDYLMDTINISMNDIGEINLELGSIRDNFISSMLINTIEKYHFLPDMARKMKNKNIVINEVICKCGIDDSAMLSLNSIYEDLLNSKIQIRNNLRYSNRYIEDTYEESSTYENNIYEENYNDYNTYEDNYDYSDENQKHKKECEDLTEELEDLTEYLNKELEDINKYLEYLEKKFGLLKKFVYLNEDLEKELEDISKYLEYQIKEFENLKKEFENFEEDVKNIKIKSLKIYKKISNL